MKLILENFKCYTKKEFDIPDEGLVLIDGPSGSGKSTIFKGILYALWGSVAVKKPTTFGANGCRVTLQFANMNIIRTSKPRNLKVGELEDEPAQAFINAQLGMTWGQFINSSYIPQKNNASILSLSPTEMLEMIKTCSFEGENSELLFEKLKGLIKGVADSLLGKRGELTSLQRQLTTLNGEMKHVEFPLQVLPGQTREAVLNIYYSRRKNFPKIFQELLSEKGRLQKIIEDFHKAKERIIAIINHQSSLKLEELTTKLRDKPVGIRDRLTALEREIALTELVRKRSDLVANLNEIHSIKNKEVAELEALLVNFNEKEIQKELQALQQIVTEWESDREKEAAIQAFMKKWGAPVGLGYDQMISYFTNNIIHCPTCSSYLLLDNDQVKVIEKPDFECSQSNEVKQKALRELTKLIPPKNQIDENTNYQSKERLTILNQEWTQSKEYIQRLKALQGETTLTNRLQQQINDLDKKLSGFTSTKSSEEIQTEYHQLKLVLEQYDEIDRQHRHAQSEYKNLERERDTLEKSVNEIDIDQVTNELKDLNKDIQQLQKQEREDYAIQDLVEAYNSFIQGEKRKNKLHEEIAQIEKELASLEVQNKAFGTLKDRFNRAQVLALDNTIASINEHTQYYLDTFFPENKLAVALKTSDLDKKTFKIDVKINFKGNEYDNIQELSGGEFDRCTLASVCGINTMLNSPILILDESLSALDSDTNTEIIRFLSDLSKTRLILVCSHEAVRGIFDHVISS